METLDLDTVVTSSTALGRPQGQLSSPFMRPCWGKQANYQTLVDDELAAARAAPAAAYLPLGPNTERMKGLEASTQFQPDGLHWARNAGGRNGC